MILIKAQYEWSNKKNTFFALLVGETPNKYVLILDQVISKSDATKIRINLPKLYNYTLPNKVKWLRENVRTAYNKGYKEMFTSRVKILDRISLLEAK